MSSTFFGILIFSIISLPYNQIEWKTQKDESRGLKKALAYGLQKNYIIHPELNGNGCLVKGSIFAGQGENIKHEENH